MFDCSLNFFLFSHVESTNQSSTILYQLEPQTTYFFQINLLNGTKSRAENMLTTFETDPSFLEKVFYEGKDEGIVRHFSKLLLSLSKVFLGDQLEETSK